MTDDANRSALLYVTSCALGLAAESGAAFALLSTNGAQALALHVLSALALACAAPRGARAGWVAFSLALSLPGSGALGLCGVVLPAWRAARAPQIGRVIELSMPLFDQAVQLSVEPVTRAPVEAVLLTQSSLPQRVAAVMALRRIEAQRAVPLLRVALGDESEEVRLLAYGILEGREKELRRGIDLGLRSLASEHSERAADGGGHAARLWGLARDHWELVHGGFVTGDGARATLEVALGYGRAAFDLQPDGSLALLLARIALRAGDPAHAVSYLASAQAAGLDRSLCAPLIAEAAFLLRRFDAIAGVLDGAESALMERPGLAAVVEFWSGVVQP